MGSTAILIGAVALGTTLVCLFLGYRWGRSNVRSQVEGALEMARVSADAREYSVREQLEETMLELAKLRARADQVQIAQGQLAKVQSPGSQSAHTAGLVPAVPQQRDTQTPPEDLDETKRVSAAAQKAAQGFSNSKDEKPRQRAENQDARAESSRSPVAKSPARFPNSFASPNSTTAPARPPAVQPNATKPPASQPVTPKSPSLQPSATLQSSAAKSPAVQPSAAKPPGQHTLTKPPAVQPPPAKSPMPRGRPAVNNADWDEFAKSLEALKKLQK